MQINKYLMEEQLKTALQQAAKQRHSALSVSSSATPFGCCTFFEDACQDGALMSLHFAGQLPLLDWMGFGVTKECTKRFDFITYVRPERSGENATVGYLSDPCETPNGWEFGHTYMTIDDFPRYGRLGPTRDVMKQDVKHCASSPQYRLDGSMVTSQDEWDIRFTTDTIIQDLSRDMVTGNSTNNAGQMDGLETLVSTMYNKPLDSVVINWNGNPMSGGAGITWNGAAVGSTFDFVNVLQATVRRIKQRISWAPMLRNAAFGLGDMVLVMPTHMAECLLDFFTCWSVCDGAAYNEVNLNTYEARQFRNDIRGGLFGYGQITIDSMPIPILAYDWGLIKTPNTSDIYLLTRGVGTNRMWYGEHFSAEFAAREYGGNGYFQLDGGRILGKWEDDNECIRVKLWMHPRIYTTAPWAQVRFQNVRCAGVVAPLSPDPEESSFSLMGSSYTAATCP